MVKMTAETDAEKTERLRIEHETIMMMLAEADPEPDWEEWRKEEERIQKRREQEEQERKEREEDEKLFIQIKEREYEEGG